MDRTLSDLLEQRLRVATRRRVGSSIVATLLHVAGAAAFIVVPAISAREPAPIEYTRVQIVPLQALGVRDPEPVRPRPQPVREPEPEPAPPAPEPEREEVKRVPSPDAEPRRRPEPRRPQPSAGSSGEQGADRPAQRQGSPDGSPLGLAPFGSNQSGFDDPNFKYSYYTDMLHAIIGSNYLRPAISVEVELIIHFRVARDGRIYDVEIVQPSGYASFDQAGLSAVRSSTLPSLPVSYKHESLGVSLIIR